MAYLTTNSATTIFVLTLALNKYIASKVVYFIWCFIINFFQSGILLMFPQAYVKCFGQNNLVLMHGIGGLLGVKISIINKIK
jgi:hypothetical protein